MRLLAALSALAAALLVVAGAGARGDVDPGLTATTIALGATAPLSSGDAAVARGAAAYFRHVNARGGVGGRTIVYRVVDDAGDPALAQQAARRLVEQVRVFAVAGTVGTEQSLAVGAYLDAARVPHLFAASGAAGGLQPAHRFEGWVYGRYLGRARPDARVAVLFQDDGFGRELLAGLRDGLSGARPRVVATEPYVPGTFGVQAQVTRLRASGANVFALFATPRAAAAALNTWRPGLVVVAADGRASGVAEGALSLGFLKDPAEPRWREDPAVRLYRTIMARYAAGANAGDARHVWGMAIAYETVAVLRAAGETPTRSGVRARLSRLDDPSNPFLLPGIEVETGAADRFPLEQAQLLRFTGGRWRSFGGLWGPAPRRG